MLTVGVLKHRHESLGTHLGSFIQWLHYYGLSSWSEVHGGAGVAHGGAGVAHGRAGVAHGGAGVAHGRAGMARAAHNNKLLRALVSLHGSQPSQPGSGVLADSEFPTSCRAILISLASIRCLPKKAEWCSHPRLGFSFRLCPQPSARARCLLQDVLGVR